MAELIKITEKDGRRAVNARELHAFLGVGRDFSNWMKDRIDKFGFAENQDYEVFANFGDNPQGGRPQKEYALSIDMAKELSMVENNERGRQARRYFIECEKQAKQLTRASYQIEDPVERAQKWIEEEKERQRLALESKENAPKVLFAEAVVGSKSSCLIGELAKVLTQNGYNIGQNRLFAWLRTNGYLGKKGEYYNVPNQEYVEQGLFEIKKSVHSTSEGVMRTTTTTKVTGKGQQYFVNKFLGGEQPRLAL